MFINYYMGYADYFIISYVEVLYYSIIVSILLYVIIFDRTIICCNWFHFFIIIQLVFEILLIY